MTGVRVVLGLAALVAACVFVIWIQAKRVKRRESENKALRQANRDAAARLERIRRYIAKNKIVTEEAEREKRGLEKTPDGDLVRRANDLFGVRDRRGGDTSGD
jgi:2-methylaconitate cis-trans-isomerase PrpF